MAFIRNIVNYDLVVNDKPVSFAVKNMREIEAGKNAKNEGPHRHNYYTVIWAKNVMGEHKIDLNTFRIEKDMLFFIHPEQVHHLHPENDPEGLVILFTRDFLNNNGMPEKFIRELNLFHSNGSAGLLKLPETHPELNELANKLEATYRTSDPYKEARFGAYLKLFLILCNELAATQQTLPLEMQMPPEIVQKFKKMVDLNYLEWHKVNDYAEKLLISPNYLNEVIKKNTGRTAKEHIRNRLIDEARRLSHFTHLSSKEIGFQLGFNDPSHFAKFLKKYVSKDSI